MSDERWWGLCPACGKQFGCPCEACQERKPEQTPTAIAHIIGSGNTAVCLEQCPHCGFIETLEWWEQLSIDIAYARDKYAAYALEK